MFFSEKSVQRSAGIKDVPGADAQVIADFGGQDRFFFGMATAPAHVEDNLEDGWLAFAREGKVKAFSNVPAPEQRLRFWSDPAPELDLAAASGAKVLRMGVDWGRLAPHRPGSLECGGPCPPGVQDLAALKRYREIVQQARGRGLSIMMTLFHHSAPRWAMEMGGWEKPEMVDYFAALTRDVVTTLAPDVDLWITVNEPAAYLLFTYVAGMWPPGKKVDPFAFTNLGPIKGAFAKALDNMVEAHKRAYQMIHQLDTTIADPGLPDASAARVGIAHVGMVSVPARIIDLPSTRLFEWVSKFMYPDAVINHLDFFGLNYYGEEIVRGAAPEIRSTKEYSESGRAVYPRGLFQLLSEFNNRYNVQKERRVSRDGVIKTIPFVVSENGISDSTDILRPAYTVEHLLAVHHAIRTGVPVQGYVAWTLSDNWEWLDGYCPKFGFAAVDRANNFKRLPRDSFALFTNIAKSGTIADSQRQAAWELVRANVGKPRPFCRAADGQSSLDTPIERNIVDEDWRFKP
jgi:beta-glucosidase/6-phospho-beta-glucosidase/beta-galactosidase